MNTDTQKHTRADVPEMIHFHESRSRCVRTLLHTAVSGWGTGPHRRWQQKWYMCKITRANTHFVHHRKTKTLSARLAQSIVRSGMICSYFLPFLFFFLLMNSSSVRANNGDSSNERADNSAAILTGINRSGGWWHSWWDMESGRKVKRERERDRKGKRRGDVALPSDCKANFKRSFQSGRMWISGDEANKKEVNTRLRGKCNRIRGFIGFSCEMIFIVRVWKHADV